jgi:DNA-binding response OmpR family regulator
MRSRVLVVDNEPQLLTLFVDALAEAGYETIGAESVREARQAFGRGPFDALVLDRRLDDGTSADVQEFYEGVPALTISGTRGGDLQKPFTLKTLVAAVNALLVTGRVS